MSVAFLDLGRSVAEGRTEIDAALARVLGEARFVGGSTLEEFERAFAAFCGRAGAEVVSLPLYPQLTTAEAERVVEAVCR